MKIKVVLMSLLLTSCCAQKNIQETPFVEKNECYDCLEWWKEFDDPILVGLIKDAVLCNHDLKSAEARICEARAMTKAATSALLPNITASGTYQRFRFSDNGIIPIPTFEKAGLIDEKHDLFDLGFDATWELDIFGKNRCKIQSAKERICQSIENYRDVKITLAAEVAKNYMNLRGEQQLLATYRDRLYFQEEMISDVQHRGDSGLASDLELSQVRTLKSSIAGEVASLEGSIKSSMFRLSVLTGKHPTSLVSLLEKEVSLPRPPEFDPEYIGADVLVQRPDVRASQRAMMAQSAEVGSAEGAMMPNLWLFALYRFQSMTLSDLFKSGSQWWFLGPFVNWQLFERYQLQANLDFTKAQYERAIEEFKQRMLLALEDVESSQVFFKASRSRLREQSEALKSSEQTVLLTEKLLNVGLKGYVHTLQAELETTRVRENYIRARTDHNIQAIRLFKALGGGWRVL